MEYVSVKPVARECGIISEPVVALMIMGRKRPGFDPEWGAEIQAAVVEAVEKLPWQVVIPSLNIADDAGLVRAVSEVRSAGVTALILVQPTISDGRLAPLLARLWDKPPILWATPEKPDGSMISANSLVGTHVMAANLRQLGRQLELVYGHPADEPTRTRLEQAIRVVHAADSIRNRKFGLIGNHAPGFVDFHADPVFLSASLGSQLYQMSTVELVGKVEGFSDGELSEDYTELLDLGLSPGESFPATDPEVKTALMMQARYYRAFRSLFAEEGFDALAFRCWPDLPNLTGHWPYLALAKAVSEGFPIAMEGDVDGAICSRIAESAGMGPVYLSDWLEHDRSTITIWHTGAAPFQMADHPEEPTGPRLGVQFNNHLPTVVESTIRAGRMLTVFRIWRFDGKYHMTALEGESIVPQRHLKATNGLFRTDRVDVTVWFEEMVQQGMPHHLCVISGHHQESLRRIARLSGMVWL